jgi:hypothetical protein
MVAASAIQADGSALTAVACAAVAVLAGNVFRPAATLAVLLTVAVIVIADTPPMLAAVAGLSAAAYLVLRHTAGALVGMTAPTVVGAVGFTIAGLAATAIPVELPWAPLVAPLVVLALFVLVTRPFWSDRSTR